MKINFKKKAIVTGCAGFIGSTLVDKLLDLNYHIIGIDNLSSGQKTFLKSAFTNKNFKFFRCDILNLNRLKKIFKNSNIVFHFAANADVRFGYKHPYKDL